MNKKIASVALAASVLGGATIGSFITPPMAAFAADATTAASADATARTPGQWITDSLKGLVTDGTLTEEQSAKVASALQAAEPEKHRGIHKGGEGGGKVVAPLLGMSEEDLRTALETKSMADLAREKGVDVQKVIDALVAAETSHIDQDVTAGKLTQADADAMKATVVEHITAAVNNVHQPHDHDMGDGDGKMTKLAPNTAVSADS